MIVVLPQEEKKPDAGVERWLVLEPHDAYLEGRGEGLFAPNASMTRAEAAIDKGQGARFDDVPENHWAFYEIVEAATTHGHCRTAGKESWGRP